jgi:hypothetical protein
MAGVCLASSPVGLHETSLRNFVNEQSEGLCVKCGVSVTVACRILSHNEHVQVS